MSIFRGRKSQGARRSSLGGEGRSRRFPSVEGLERRELLAADALSVSVLGTVNALDFVGSTDDIDLTISGTQFGGGAESYTFQDGVDVIDVTNTAPGVTVVGDGTNSVTVSGLTTGSTQLSYQQGGAASTVALQSSADPVAIKDAISGGSTTLLLGDASGLATGITSSVSVVNTGSSTALTIDDSGDAEPTNPSISPADVVGITGGTVDLTTANLSSLTIDGGSGGNTFDVNGTSGNVVTTINTGTGSNSTTVGATTGGSTLTINPQGTDDSINLGNGDAGTLAGSTQVTPIDSGGTLSIVVDDSTDATPVSATLSSATLGVGAINGYGPGGITYPVDFATSLMIEGGGGGNTMTVDFDTNNPLPLGQSGFDYVGGGGDTLVLSGSPTVAFAQETYFANLSQVSFNDGSFLSFSGLAPVIDTVPVAAFTFNPSSTAQVVDLGDGAVVGAAQTLLISSGDATPAFEKVSVANKGTVTVDDSAGTAETTVLNVPTASTGLTALVVLGSSGDDLVQIVTTPANVATSVSLNGGSDTVQLTLSGVALVPASLSLDGGGGPNTVDIDAGGDALTSPPISGMPSTVAVAGGQSVALNNFVTVNISDVAGPTLTASTPLTLPFVAGANQSGVTVGRFTSSVSNLPPSEFTATINWGDGTPATAGTIVVESPGVYDVLGSHTYATSGTFTLSVVVNDLGGNVTTTTGGVTSTVTYDGGGTVALAATADVTSSSAIGTISPSIFTGVVEGVPLTNVVVASFTSTSATASAGMFTAIIDWGDGTPDSAGTITPVAPGGGPLTFDVTGTHTYASSTTSGAKIHVTVYDQNGHQAGTVATVPTIADAPLVSGTGVPLNAVSGAGLFNVTVATFVDPNTLGSTAQISADIDWGDGTSGPGTVVLAGGVAGGLEYQVEGSHRYSTVTAFGFTVKVTVNDVGGQTLTINALATVAPATLTGHPITVTGIEGQPLPGNVLRPSASGALMATFTSNDPTRVASDYIATIDFGDGTPDQTVLVQSDNSLLPTEFEVFGSHTYARPGTYAVTVVAAQNSNLAIFPPIRLQSATIVSTAVIADAALTAVTPAPTVTATENGTFTEPVASFADGDPASTPADFSATIDWGDGSPDSAGTITQPGGVGTAFIVSGTHNYTDSGVNGGFGTYPILIHILDVDGSQLNVVNTASVADVPIFLDGRLNPTSDTGESDQDGVTKDDTPDFFGTSEPGSTIKLYAYPTAGGSSILIGQGVTSAAGVWNITSARLADGGYLVGAFATDKFGHTTADAPILTGSDGGPLVIDTVGPRVEEVEFDRLSGQILIEFQDDRSGLNVSTLVNASNYVLTKANTRPFTYLFNSLTPDATGGATSPVFVLATINKGRQLRGGQYVLSIHSGGVTDVAGNALDGEFYGTFPSGNGNPGGDFVAKLNAIHTIIFPPETTVGAASPVKKGRVPVTRHIPPSVPTDTAVTTAPVKKSAVTAHHVVARTMPPKVKVVAKTPTPRAKAVHDAALAHVTVPKPRRR